ncbi:MAG: ATP-binding protein [Bacteroidales bacterium]|nr:ATP-binding protein [Bacteroidales bacterium]
MEKQEPQKEKDQEKIEFSETVEIQETQDNEQYIKISNLWVSAVIDTRLMEMNTKTEPENIIEIPDTFLDNDNPIGQILQEVNGNEIDYALLATALTSKLYESYFTPLVSSMQKHPEIGGVYSEDFHEFMPTLKTVSFFICGYKKTDNAFVYESLLSSRLLKEQIIELIPSKKTSSLKHAIVRLNDKYFSYIAKGRKPQLGITPDFPAQQLVTKRTFDEIILKESTKQQLEDLILYAKHHQTIEADKHASKVIKQGFIGLFYGPPGTGKSLTASVIGNELGIDVYRIDLSRLVSKYIGETEKNLERVFQRFDGKNCILFFDEADSLFGKRSEVKDAKDRYANQEISYLLQRVESFSGLVILASNLKENMDDAFKRRVLSWTFFPRPEAEDRLKLWNIHLPESFEYESDDMIEAIAQKYELTGAYIANVVKLSCLRALDNESRILTQAIIEPYIIDIYKREGVNKNFHRTPIQRNPNLSRN